ncbi:MAG TPA: NACHT domain-containing protein, partial [Polyangiaceae bacterium]|nr:NACHT domain-containing protein [Polyangiaceae bacterium]
MKLARTPPTVPADDLEEHLRAVVDSLFVETSRVSSGNGSLPRIMVDRRRERARERLLDALVWRGSAEISTKRREELKRLVARWSARDFEPGFAEAEELEIACAQERERKEAEAAGDPKKLFELQEQAHRRAIVAAHGSIEIRGLQMSARVHQDLDVAFVPLHIEDPSQAREVKFKEGFSLRHIPRLDVVEIVKRHDRVLLVGAPGSGKTTLVSFLAASAAAGKLREKAGWGEDPVPFVVPVRSLSRPVVDVETIASIAGCEAAFVRAVLEQKRALLLVDGLDEAGSDRLRELIPSIQCFAKAYSGNKIVLTTRPAAGAEDERSRVKGFETTRLLPLTRDEVYLFIDRWCLAAELSIQKDKQKAREDAERAAADLKGRVQTSRAVERLAETPLMASVLCIVHRFLGQRVPERRAALYEACTNVLLYEWDRAKFPEGSSIGRLDAEMKRVLLGCVAREMHINELAEIPTELVIKQFSSRLSMFAG